MSRKYVRNGGNRRSTNGQPGQWSPLFATAATPGIGGGQTVMQIFASQYGCSVNPLVPDALQCYLVATVGGSVVELQASALTAEGDDGQGTLARLVFDAEIDPASPWYLRIPAGWTAMRARDGAPVSGLLCPSGLVATPPQGSIGVSNMLDVVPPQDLPNLWVPLQVTMISSNSVTFFTGGVLILAPQPSEFQLDGTPASEIISNGGGHYTAVSTGWFYSPGDTAILTIPAYAGGWDLSDNSKVGLVSMPLTVP